MYRKTKQLNHHVIHIVYLDYFITTITTVLYIIRFAVWNTMMGTSLLSMPWAIERAGVVAGLLLILFMAAVCLYTAYRNLQVYSVYGRFFVSTRFTISSLNN